MRKRCALAVFVLLSQSGSAGPDRDRKTSLHDGGIHAPRIVRWPARFPAEAIDTETVFGGVDLLPTLAALAGTALPRGLNGENLSAALLGTPHQRTKPLFWIDRPGWSALRDIQWKAHWQDSGFRLYDLANDPSESKNVADEHPDLATPYHRQLQAWESSLPGGGD